MRDRDEQDVHKKMGEGMNDPGNRGSRPGQSDPGTRRGAEGNDPDDEMDRDAPTKPTKHDKQH